MDKAPFSKTLEHSKSAVGQNIAFARVADDAAYLAVLVAFMMDGPTKSEFMQNTLLVL